MYTDLQFVVNSFRAILALAEFPGIYCHFGPLELSEDLAKRASYLLQGG